MLEDDFTDVIRKAMRGRSMTSAQVAHVLGMKISAIEDLLAGRWDEPVVRRVAGLLALGVDAMAALPRHVPPVLMHPAVVRLELPFESHAVNAWLIDTGEQWLLVDTGFDVESLRAELAGVCRIEEIRHVIVTHDHRDHVGGLGLFDRKNVMVYGPSRDARWAEMRPGRSMTVGKLRVVMRDLAGHAEPALGLEIHGLGIPLAVCGDALFAGSMGGCRDENCYQAALGSLAVFLESLDCDTWLLCGHGPVTRLREEWNANPFLAGGILGAKQVSKL